MDVRSVPRTEWSARDPRHVTRVDPSQRRRYVVHHSTGRNLGDRSLFAWVRNIQAYHMDVRGWSDIGYNELYGYDPAEDRLYVFKGRGNGVLGAHVAGHNTTSIGGCFLGDYRDGRDTFTAEMWQFVTFRREQLSTYAGRSLTLLGHSHLAPTACPGHQIRRAIEGEPPAGAPAPPATSDWTEEAIMALPTLREGNRGSDVKRLQGLLAAAGYAPDNTFSTLHTPDGAFGPSTRLHVQAFQQDHQVPNSVRADGKGDGIVGRHTWTALLGQ